MVPNLHRSGSITFGALSNDAYAAGKADLAAYLTCRADPTQFM
jgi:hypothetical protein